MEMTIVLCPGLRLKELFLGYKVWITLHDRDAQFLGSTVKGVPNIRPNLLQPTAHLMCLSLFIYDWNTFLIEIVDWHKASIEQTNLTSLIQSPITWNSICIRKIFISGLKFFGVLIGQTNQNKKTSERKDKLELSLVRAFLNRFQEMFFVSPAKHSGKYGSLCPASVRWCVCPVVTLSW